MTDQHHIITDYLQKLEEQTLFEMSLIEASEEALEKQEILSQQVKQARRSKIDELDKNIKEKEESKNAKQTKLNYFSTLLDLNNQRPG